MAFEVWKQHKLEDRMEQEAWDWVMYCVQEQFGVDDFEELTEEQVDEISEYANSDAAEYFAPYVCGVLNSMCDTWYEALPKLPQSDVVRLAELGDVLHQVERLKDLQAERGVITERSLMINAMLDQVIFNCEEMKEKTDG